MKIAVVGGGGREHAVIKKLMQGTKTHEIYALPGNGGIAQDAQCVAIKATDIEKIVDFALEHKIDLVVATPDDPLAMGLVDLLAKNNIRAFGPTKAAAQIESSKVFAKKLMLKYNIPTAGYMEFDCALSAEKHLKDNNKYPIVIKADGLALGKGVIIAQDFESASAGVQAIMNDKIFGTSGNKIIIEEFLTGPEVSVLAFTDGKTLVPMVASMDHKRALDGDLGLNTGGMGVIAPNPFYTKDIAEQCMQQIFLPTIAAMNAEDCKFRGCLYFGLMLTADGPKVIEYNCRFGDPETQAVLPLLQSDLLEIFEAVIDEKLEPEMVRFSQDASCCVIMASGGYPQKYETGLPISGIENAEEDLQIQVYHSGTKQEKGHMQTAGGRVLGVTAIAENIERAQKLAYAAAAKIEFKNAHYRRDIGNAAIAKIGGNNGSL